MLDRDGKLLDRDPYPVQVWQCGNTLKLIVLGGEAVVDDALRLKKEQHGVGDDLGGRRLEGGEAMNWEDIPCPFAPAVEEIIVSKVDELVERTRAGPNRSY